MMLGVWVPHEEDEYPELDPLQIQPNSCDISRTYFSYKISMRLPNLLVSFAIQRNTTVC